LNLGIQQFREKDPDFTCVVDPDGREWSRDEFVSSVNRLGRAFRSGGLGDGDVVAIVSPNSAEYLVVYFAATQAGLSVVPVNWHLAEPELGFMIDDSSAKAIVAHESLGEKRLARLRQLGSRVSLWLSIGYGTGYINIRDFSRAEPDVPLNLPTVGRMMAYTSATTGRPKAVVFPPGNVQASLKHKVEANRLVGILPEDDNVNLCPSMLYHSAPLGGCELALNMGHKLVLVDQWQPEMLLRLIEEHRVTTSFFVPAMFVRLLKLPTGVRDRYSVSSLRFVGHGAAPCPEKVKRAMMDWWGPIIWEAYGATEAQGTIASAEEWLCYPGTVGRPFPGSAVKILDERGEELPPNQVGLIYLRPHTGDFFEYKGDPEKTRQSYAGEFVTVGDLGYVNEEGYLFVCDRSDDLIISSGMNIYPAEIEARLVEHPAVRDCAVVGQPHELLGSVPKAFIELEEGFEGGPQLSQDVLRFLHGRLSAMKLPKRIEYIDSIPRDPNGKLYKRRLAR
jgi:long-chain acyl-CoA synthetase